MPGANAEPPVRQLSLTVQQLAEEAHALLIRFEDTREKAAAAAGSDPAV